MYNSEASTMQIVVRELLSKSCWQMLQYDLPVSLVIMQVTDPCCHHLL